MAFNVHRPVPQKTNSATFAGQSLASEHDIALQIIQTAMLPFTTPGFFQPRDTLQHDFTILNLYSYLS